jgi:putative DNA-invertase from lambdoid prophage Rac
LPTVGPTLEQNTENQRHEIEAAGFAIRPQRLIEEHISGSVAASERPGFIRLLDRMESGDVLIVTKLDRLGRNAMDIRKTVEQLATLDIRVHCLALEVGFNQPGRKNDYAGDFSCG